MPALLSQSWQNELQVVLRTNVKKPLIIDDDTDDGGSDQDEKGVDDDGSGGCKDENEPNQLPAPCPKGSKSGRGILTEQRSPFCGTPQPLPPFRLSARNCRFMLLQ
eukprot:6214611-Pleurochrysis_carterae.AAC.1